MVNHCPWHTVHAADQRKVLIAHGHKPPGFVYYYSRYLGVGRHLSTIIRAETKRLCPPALFYHTHQIPAIPLYEHSLLFLTSISVCGRNTIQINIVAVLERSIRKKYSDEDPRQRRCNTGLGVNIDIYGWCTNTIIKCLIKIVFNETHSPWRKQLLFVACAAFFIISVCNVLCSCFLLQ